MIRVDGEILPRFWAFWLAGSDADFTLREIQTQCKFFPDFGHLEKLSSNFVGVFEGVVIVQSEKMLHTSNLDIHRRANLV